MSDIATHNASMPEANHLNENASAVGPVAPAGRRWSRRVACDLVALLDVLAIVATGGLTGWIHHWVPLGDYATSAMVAEFYLGVAILGTAVFRQSGLYEAPDMTQFPVPPGAICVLLAILYIGIFSLGISYNVVTAEPVTWFPCWFILSYATILAGRVFVRDFFSAAARRGLFNSHIAVYGSGIIAGRLREFLTGHGLGMSIIGVYDDRARTRALAADELEPIGKLTDLIEAGRAGLVDEIIIALPATADQRIREVARTLEQLPVSLHVCSHIVSDLIDASAVAHKVSNIGPIGLIDIKRKPLADWGALIKSFEDRLLGGIFLVLALPLLALIAIAIKLDSKGPVLFRQRRHGLNRRSIEVLKFRTMGVAENGHDVRQATKNDPRVTRVGRFLRRTSLDELPQLINVLRGDMSLVGPRPHAVVHDEYYGEMLERYANRQQVKPGITGWAQINGFRGETQTPDKMQARVEHDLYYIDNWSLGLDLWIIAATPFVGLTHKNAY